MRYILPMFCFFLVAACKMQPADLHEQAKKDIADAEKAFEKMAEEKGIAEGFCYFADSNAIIKRGDDSLIIGKDGIKHFYARPYFKTASVSWSPDFIDASIDGTMGYTYGKYIWVSKDSTGKTKELKGIFHTVWKKQKDGSWKYVWD
ncbi:YybH family protein [Parasediminibacterium sp. JCM 36343]|uniref:YybH family protein n=1 Tax=Parasediminibacterium sp. JCM 36343 TaxID=3374279 RepID=UPI0039794795